MESTGIYWIPLFELLESRGFTVYLVNARHVKNVSGRKSDVLDCQWLQQLMSYGLLSGRLPAEGRDLCPACRVAAAGHAAFLPGAACPAHAKALAQMNVQLANVISDIVGETDKDRARHYRGRTGRARLAQMKNVRIRASEAKLPSPLRGNWREEHLFALRQAMALYDAYGSAWPNAISNSKPCWLRCSPKRPVIRARIDAARGPGMPRNSMSGPICSGCGRRSDPHQRHRHDDCAESDFRGWSRPVSLQRVPSTSRPGWGCARERRFPGQSPLPAPASAPPTGRPRPCGWLPRLCVPASLPWAPTPSPVRPSRSAQGHHRHRP